MKKNITLLLIAVLLISCETTDKSPYNIDSVASPKGTEVFQPNWDNIASNYEYPEWFIDGKFGIFIHWGAYAVPAFGNEWYPRNIDRKSTRLNSSH